MCILNVLVCFMVVTLIQVVKEFPLPLFIPSSHYDLSLISLQPLPPGDRVKAR